jgi:hypothetical protein
VESWFHFHFSKFKNVLNLIQIVPLRRGDTLGTMDMQAPSVFTGPLQTPWYKPRGGALHVESS